MSFPVKRTSRRLFTAFVLFALFDGIIWYVISISSDSSFLELYFLNIGQGDSELIRFPGGVDLLIDGGPPNGKVLEELSRILPAGDTYLDLVMMSHPQLDHFGGLIDVLKKYDVGLFLGSGRAGETAAYDDLVRVLEERNVNYLALQEGDVILRGDDAISILSPNKRNLASKELNDTSVVAMLAEEDFRALYTGDIGFKIEDELARSYDLRADVLKVPHHGSKYSSGTKFLEAIQPQIAVAEVGKNTYGHPTREALGRLEDAGAAVFRTDHDGTVLVEVDQGKFSVFRSTR